MTKLKFSSLQLFLFLYLLSAIGPVNAHVCDWESINIKLEEVNNSELIRVLKAKAEIELVPDNLKFAICSDNFTISLVSGADKIMLRNVTGSTKSSVYFQSSLIHNKYTFLIKVGENKYPVKIRDEKFITLERAQSSCMNNPNIWLGWSFVDDKGTWHYDRGYCPGYRDIK